MTTIVISDHNFPDTDIEDAFAREASVRVIDATRGGADPSAALRGADIVLNMFFPMTRHVLEELAPGSLVVRYGVGVDNVDLDAARDLGIGVSNIPDYGAQTVADHTVALLLAALRRVGSFNAAIHAGGWPTPTAFGLIPGFAESTVGLIGTGRIGSAVAQRLAVFGFRVVAYDPYVAPDVAAAAGIELLPLDDLLSQADAVSLHLPLTEQTRHLVDARAIGLMKPSAVVVNTARGPLVDTAALATALRQGRLAAAALDVVEVEPLPADSELLSLENLLLTPHVAFYSEESLLALRRMVLEEAQRHLEGTPRRSAIV